jgi:hypothetical protein
MPIPDGIFPDNATRPTVLSRKIKRKTIHQWPQCRPIPLSPSNQQFSNKKTPQQIDTVVPMETDTAPAQVATIPISPNLQDIFAEYRLPTVVSPITIPCSDSVLDCGIRSSGRVRSASTGSHHCGCPDHVHSKPRSTATHQSIPIYHA